MKEMRKGFAVHCAHSNRLACLIAKPFFDNN
jgi:hypothetical protein